MSELDKRLEQHKARKAQRAGAAESELAAWKAELAAAERTLKRDLAEATEIFFAKLQAAEVKIEPLYEAQARLADAIDAEAAKVARLRRQVRVGALVLAGAVAVLLAATFLISRNMVSVAQNEAVRIRTENAEIIADARAEGEAALSELMARLASQETAIDAEIVEMGAELAQLAADRDAVRSNLEEFITLREQIGFQLVPYRNRVVIVVPDGSEIRSWGAPGLSDLARYNGRMYRVSDQR